MAYEISKKPDAPEGDIKVSLGSTHFRVKDGESYVTDDAAVAEQIEASFNEYFTVEHVNAEDEDADAKDAAKAESDALKELHKTQERAKIQHVRKDAVEPAAPVPTSLADLREIKAEDAEKTDEKKDGND
jgi:hypothetical protein